MEEFPATAPGYARLLAWLRGFGTVTLVGIEGTGSYGAGLARHICAAGIRVVEVDRSDRQDWRRAGKSDPLDAVSAARAALSGRASGAPRGRDGQVEAIRALMVAKRTARAQRTQTINQARALIITGPDDIRTRFTGQTPAELVAELATLRPRPGSMVRYHTLLALRELGRPDPSLLGQGLPAPAQPRRRPASQPRPVADRDHPDGLASADPRLCRPAQQGRPVQARDHPLPQALRRPRGLPPPPPARGLTLTLRGRPGPIFGCRTRWPANDPPAVPGLHLTCWA